MRLRPALATFLGAALLSLLPASVAYAAKPVAVHCGQVITADTKLANDLTNCPRHGIVIGADDITLDLNGHTIDGDGVPFEPCPADEPCDVGVANSGIRDGQPFNGHGYDGVTIKNGSIREFPEVGVYVTQTSDNRMRAVTTSTSAYESDGFHLIGCTRCRIEKSAASEYSIGVVVIRSHGVRIEHNDVHDNEFGGVGVFNSDDVRIVRNSVSGGGDQGGVIAGDAFGISLGGGSDGNRIEQNSVSGNGFVGVLVEEGDSNRVAANDVFRNRDGLILLGDRNTVARNTITDSLGANDGSGFGIAFDGGRDNLITNNTVERSRATGIRLGVFEPGPPSPVHNTVRLNVVRDGSLDGILVESIATDTLLDRNTVDHNGDDGIDADSASTSLTKNTANRNHDLGIEAVPGVTDGGGNRASGNGNPLQCANVFCK